MMKAIQLPPQSVGQLKALEALYRTTDDVRMRTRAPIILLAAEKGWAASAISEAEAVPGRRPASPRNSFGMFDNKFST